MKEAKTAKGNAEKTSVALVDTEKRITESIKQLSASEAKVVESEQTISTLTQELDRVRAMLEVASKTQTEITAKCADDIPVTFEDQKRNSSN